MKVYIVTTEIEDGSQPTEAIIGVAGSRDAAVRMANEHAKDCSDLVGEEDVTELQFELNGDELVAENTRWGCSYFITVKEVQS